MPEIRSIILIIPLTLNGLNNTIKKQRLSDYIKKTQMRFNDMLSTEDAVYIKKYNIK